MGNTQYCNPYNRSERGFAIQSITPSSLLMLEHYSLVIALQTEGTCFPSHTADILTTPASTILAIRQSFSVPFAVDEFPVCPLPVSIPATDAPTVLAIRQMRQNNDNVVD
jgi:hypothetical protein